MEYYLEKIGEDYTAIIDSRVLLSSINMDTIKFTIEGQNLDDDLILFDYFEERNKTKKLISCYFNLYSMLEEYKFCPILIIANDLYRRQYSEFSMSHVDILIKSITEKWKVGFVKSPIVTVPKFNLTKIEDYQYLSHIGSLRPFWYDSDRLNTLGKYRIKSNMHFTEDKVDIVIISSTEKLLEQCIGELVKITKYDNYNVFIAWFSDQPVPDLKVYRRAIKNDIKVVVIEPNDFNFSRINNYMINNYCKSSYVILMNDDIVVLNEEWITELMSVLATQRARIVGCALYYPGGKYNRYRDEHELRYQHCGVGIIDNYINHFNRRKLVKANYISSRKMNCVTFALVLIDRALFNFLGGLDEDFSGDFNDIDFCIRAIKTGCEVWYCANAEAIHYESATRKEKKIKEDKTDRKIRSKHEIERFLYK